MGIVNTILARVVAMALLGSSAAFAQIKVEKSNNWLLDAPDDKERFKRIENMFGGYSGSMVETANRYSNTFDAIAEGNFDLAVYHWKKLKQAIEAGNLRRPGRESNAIDVFLSGPFKPLLTALESKDSAKSKEAFLAARDACIKCHESERVPFMNDQALFRRTANFPLK